MMRYFQEIGYKVMDINLRFIKFDEFFLNKDNWEEEVDKIGNEAAKLGIEFSQSHIPYYNLDQVDEYLVNPELHAWFVHIPRKCLDFGGIFLIIIIS